MTDLRKAAEMALESLEDFGSDSIALKLKARMTLRQVLAESANSTTDFVEPVAWVYRGKFHPFDPSDWAEGETATPLYTAPPKREWVGLTRRELDIATLGLEDLGDCYLAIEAKLKEKNA